MSQLSHPWDHLPTPGDTPGHQRKGQTPSATPCEPPGKAGSGREGKIQGKPTGPEAEPAGIAPTRQGKAWPALGHGHKAAEAAAGTRGHAGTGCRRGLGHPGRAGPPPALHNPHECSAVRNAAGKAGLGPQLALGLMLQGTKALGRGRTGTQSPWPGAAQGSLS